MAPFTIVGNLVSVHDRTITSSEIEIAGGIITRITSLGTESASLPYVMPGFVDAHVHIESSLLMPSEFARMAVIHGTVATVSDPHEIANVVGIDGVKLMIENGKQVPLKFNFGAPSCVPATVFETAGAEITVTEIEELFRGGDVRYLSEMMNFPGVLFDDPAVIAKLDCAKRFGFPIDGHAPALRGENARSYAGHGISTDHECFTLEEALDKIECGMKILIREGSAARNFDALHPLLRSHPTMCMFCSDDKHPDTLAIGHINELVKRSLALGYDLFDVLRCASSNPVNHYGLDVGLLRIGDPTDFILVDSLVDFNIIATFINGEKVAERGLTLIESTPIRTLNQFNCSPKTDRDFDIRFAGERANVRVIEAIDGQLITPEVIEKACVEFECIASFLLPSIERDILKISVVNRYADAPPAVGFIKNFGLTHGAIASSVAHDSHNIVVVGADDQSICKAVNAVIECHGALVVVDEEGIHSLPLPVAGLMSDRSAWEVAERYAELDQRAKALGSKLSAPFMTLSFMALLVIPDLKLSDQGLFDGRTFEFVEVAFTD